MRALNALAIFIPPVAQALLVVPSSTQCAVLCGNAFSSTEGQEITCNDLDYASSTYGATFEACVACELSSDYVDTATNQTDLQWGLYNLRFALSWCLFGFDNNTSLADTPCSTSFSCAPLQSAFEFDSLYTNASEYGFCDDFVDKEAFVKPCSNCLSETGHESYLSNFVTALDAACIQKPVVGSTISISGSVFSSQMINVTTPTATPYSSYTPSNGLSLGAKIGIIIAGIIVALFLSGFLIICQGRRRRRAALAAHQKSTGYAEFAQFKGTPYGTPQGRQSKLFDSPPGWKPLKQNWFQRSPKRADAEKAYFSPPTSSYTTPVNATEPSMRWASGPLGFTALRRGAGEGSGQERNWSRDRNESTASDDEWHGERIEMVGIARNGEGSEFGSPHSQGPGSEIDSRIAEGLIGDDARAGIAL